MNIFRINSTKSSLTNRTFFRIPQLTSFLIYLPLVLTMDLLHVWMEIIIVEINNHIKWENKYLRFLTNQLINYVWTVPLHHMWSDQWPTALQWLTNCSQVVTLLSICSAIWRRKMYINFSYNSSTLPEYHSICCVSFHFKHILQPSKQCQ